MDAANVSQAIAALSRLGYQPRAPVRLDEFADPAKRSLWVLEKNMTVFSLFSAEHPATELDLFVEPPLDFDTAYRSAVRMEVALGVAATFIGLADLLSLKQQAGRTQDLLDIEKLTALRREHKS